MIESAGPERPAVSCSDWLDGGCRFMLRVEQDRSGTNGAFATCKSVNQNREKTRLQNERCAQKTSGDAPRVMSRSRKKLFPPERAQPSNENKMSDGGRGRAPLAVKVRKSFER